MFVIRLLEMEQCIRIIKQAARDLPEGPIRSKVSTNLKPMGEIYHQIESWRGILGFYLVGDGNKEPHRLHIHGPSFINLGVFPELVKGEFLQDAIATFASIDVVLGEIDR